MPEDTTPPVETAPAKAPSPDVTPPAAPVANAVDPAEVESLKKAAEQKDLRIRQLENEKAAADKAAADAKAKELEDNQQFKTLAEQEKAKREALEAEIATKTKADELKSETDKALADYSPEVKKLAETTGLTLTDTTDEAVAAFKAKLEEVKGLVGTSRVNPNNPNNPTPEGPNVYDADGMIKTPLENSPDKLDEIFKSMPGIASMMGPKVEQ